MTGDPVGRGLQIVGLVAIVFVVLYWRQLKWAYENRATIQQASDAADLYGQAKGLL